MKAAIAAAHEHGVGIVAIRGSNHSGAMAYYARMAVEADMIGWATTNALPTMAPPFSMTLWQLCKGAMTRRPVARRWILIRASNDCDGLGFVVTFHPLA